MKKKKYLFGIIILGILFVLMEVTKYDDVIKITNDVEFAVKENNITVFEEIENLRKKYNNNDIVGQIEILNTDFKEPLLQSKDNNYYLRRSPYKNYDVNGSIFLDYRTKVNDRKLIVYGHHDAYLDMPFDILENYYNYDYMKNHKYVQIKTYDNKIRKYELFSIYIEPKDFSYMKVDLDPSSYNEHLKYLKNKSMYNVDTNINDNDNILILQTCSTHKDYQKYSKKYLILAFKEVK